MTFFNNIFISFDAPRLWGVYIHNSTIPHMESYISWFCILWICAVLILLIILASIPISSLLNPENKEVPELKQDQVPKEKPSRDTMDLVFTRMGDIGKPFVYDKLDPTGSKLNTLFLGRNYDTVVLQGISGIEVSVGGASFNRGVNGVRTLKVGYLPEHRARVESTTDILSGGVPIDTSPSIYDSRKFLVKEAS